MSDTTKYPSDKTLNFMMFQNSRNCKIENMLTIDIKFQKQISKMVVNWLFKIK